MLLFTPLLFACDWKKGETYSAIFQKYVDKCIQFGVSVVVFDGYDEESTKDTARAKRSKISSITAEITKNG